MKKNVIVVGGGLAGLAATLRLCENGCHVQLISLTVPRRSHSVCAQGGINAAIGPGDTPLLHAVDTITAGDFLANQPPVLEMCVAAPSILQMMDHLGCLFNRKEDGSIALRRFGGTFQMRTAYCGSSTGQQLHYALDEQVRRLEEEKSVQIFSHHEFLRLVQDDLGRARGVIVHDFYTLQIQALQADAVVIATGGLGVIYKKSTNSSTCTGAANGRLFMQGMRIANGEFIQIHPTAIAGEDKLRLISESVRGEGGRIWVPGNAKQQTHFPDGSIRQCGDTGKPWYFLEEMYPDWGNLVPRDIGTREIVRICEEGLGVDGEMQVYLDVTHLSKENFERIASVLNIYKKFTGEDPVKMPMKIFPAVHYSMGGAWVDWPARDDLDQLKRFRQMTSLKGCFNVGESDFLFHGANRLGGNSLLSCIFSGLIAGEEVPRYIDTEVTGASISPTRFSDAAQLEESEQKKVLESEGKENIYHLHDELSQTMLRHVSVQRTNSQLQETLDQIKAIRERYSHISLGDRGNNLNQTYVFARQFRAMMEMALVITKGALERNESRGAHFKPEFPHRDDVHFLKTTIASYSHDEPKIDYEAVDTRYLSPILRESTQERQRKVNLQNIPRLDRRLV